MLCAIIPYKEREQEYLQHKKKAGPNRKQEREIIVPRRDPSRNHQCPSIHFFT
jgi:hypothetical protein